MRFEGSGSKQPATASDTHGEDGTSIRHAEFAQIVVVQDNTFETIERIVLICEKTKSEWSMMKLATTSLHAISEGGTVAR